MKSNYSPVFPSFFLTFFSSLLCVLLVTSCEEDAPLASTFLKPVTQIRALDNGNVGNASDIEVNFNKQLTLTDIKEYRILVSKDPVASGFELEAALGVGPDRYTAVAPGEIYPIQGKVLNANAKDLDGENIVGGKAYRFLILSISKDETQIRSSLSIDEENFTLQVNSQIRDFTREADEGAGSLVMGPMGNLFMGEYNIHYRISGNEEAEFHVHKFDPEGNPTKIGTAQKLLTGNAFDSDNNLYQLSLYSDKLMKISPDQSISFIEVDGYKPRKPKDIFVTHEGIIFVLDEDFGAIIKILPDGTSTLFSQLGGRPRGITGDNAGNLYVSHDEEIGRITKIGPDGKFEVLARIPTFKPEGYEIEYFMWVGYIVYRGSHLYVAGMSTDRIYKVSLDGQVEVFAGSGIRGIPRGDALGANLNRPIGLAFSNDGTRLYISGSTDVTPQHTQYTTPGKIWEMEILE